MVVLLLYGFVGRQRHESRRPRVKGSNLASKGPRKSVSRWIWLSMPPLYPFSTISSRILVSIAALAHNCPAPKIFFHGKQEEISRFISRFDCLPCLLVLSSRRSRSPEPVVRPPNELGSPSARYWYKFHWIKLEMKAKRMEQKENTRNRSYSCAARESRRGLGKNSIKIVEMETKISSELPRHTHFSFPGSLIALIVKVRRRRWMMLIEEHR